MDKNEQQLHLSDLKAGDEAHIKSFKEDDLNLSRLRDMGLHDGIAFRVVKFTPLGDSIEIKTRGFYLSIQKSMAKQIVINRK